MTADEKLELLRQFAMFKDVDEASLNTMLDHTQEFEFGQGQLIAREGQVGTGLFIILKGQVNVIRHGAHVATSGPGDIIGELSVLAQAPRIATLVASEPVTCLGIASWQLDEILKRPGLADPIREAEHGHRQAEEQRHANEQPR